VRGPHRGLIAGRPAVAVIRPEGLKGRSQPIDKNLRTNEQIRISPVRLIGPDNEQLGIVPTNEALARAREAGMDLVEVAPTVRPPVCRIMDYGKWKYYQKKNQKKTHEQQLKEVRLRPKTDSHDRMIKVNRAKRFFKKGDKVQFSVLFRGRERAHRDIAVEMLRQIIEELKGKVKIERAPAMDGRNLIMILSPIKGMFDDVDDTVGLDEDDEAAEEAERQAAEREAAEDHDDDGDAPAAQS
jgi:translation initiation factor IF-3